MMRSPVGGTHARMARPLLRQSQYVSTIRPAISSASTAGNKAAVRLSLIALFRTCLGVSNREQMELAVCAKVISGRIGNGGFP